jgi:hypothetical protein
VITVEYPPEFFYGVNGSVERERITHGESGVLNCNSHENEKASVEWLFSTTARSPKTKLDSDSKLFNITNMKESDVGYYQCIVSNSLGSVTKYFIVNQIAKGEF